MQKEPITISITSKFVTVQESALTSTNEEEVSLLA